MEQVFIFLLIPIWLKLWLLSHKRVNLCMYHQPISGTRPDFPRDKSAFFFWTPDKTNCQHHLSKSLPSPKIPSDGPMFRAIKLVKRCIHRPLVRSSISLSYSHKVLFLPLMKNDHNRVNRHDACLYICLETCSYICKCICSYMFTT